MQLRRNMAAEREMPEEQGDELLGNVQRSDEPEEEQLKDTPKSLNDREVHHRGTLDDGGFADVPANSPSSHLRTSWHNQPQPAPTTDSGLQQQHNMPGPYTQQIHSVGPFVTLPLAGKVTFNSPLERCRYPYQDRWACVLELPTERRSSVSLEAEAETRDTPTGRAKAQSAPTVKEPSAWTIKATTQISSVWNYKAWGKLSDLYPCNAMHERVGSSPIRLRSVDAPEDSASFFAFAYPDSSNSKKLLKQMEESGRQKDHGWRLFAAIGGFIFFDAQYQAIGAMAINDAAPAVKYGSVAAPPGTIHLLGPMPITETMRRECDQSGEDVTLPPLIERGVTQFCWYGPNDGKSCREFYPYGAFAYIYKLAPLKDCFFKVLAAADEPLPSKIEQAVEGRPSSANSSISTGADGDARTSVAAADPPSAALCAEPSGDRLVQKLLTALQEMKQGGERDRGLSGGVSTMYHASTLGVVHTESNDIGSNVGQRRRPPYPSVHVPVHASIQILRVFSVELLGQQYKAEVELVLEWSDPMFVDKSIGKRMGDNEWYPSDPAGSGEALERLEAKAKLEKEGAIDRTTKERVQLTDFQRDWLLHGWNSAMRVHVWRPRLKITNQVGPAFKEVWFKNPWNFELNRKDVGALKKQRSDIIQMCVRVKGSFGQTFRLQRFPFDIQALAVCTRCTDREKNVSIVCDESTYGPDTISTQVLAEHRDPSDGRGGLDERSFPWDKIAAAAQESDMAEYKVLPVVCAEYSVRGQRDLYKAATKRNGTLVFCMWVKRTPYFFLWNVVGVVFLLVTTGFLAACVPVPLTGERLAIICTLLLTCVNYKASGSSFLERLHYNTLLDQYFLIALAVPTLGRPSAPCPTSPPFSTDPLWPSPPLRRYVLVALAFLTLQAVVAFLMPYITDLSDVNVDQVGGVDGADADDVPDGFYTLTSDIWVWVTILIAWLAWTALWLVYGFSTQAATAERIVSYAKHGIADPNDCSEKFERGFLRSFTSYDFTSYSPVVDENKPEWWLRHRTALCEWDEQKKRGGGPTGIRWQRNCLNEPLPYSYKGREIRRTTMTFTAPRVRWIELDGRPPRPNDHIPSIAPALNDKLLSDASSVPVHHSLAETRKLLYPSEATASSSKFPLGLSPGSSKGEVSPQRSCSKGSSTSAAGRRAEDGKRICDWNWIECFDKTKQQQASRYFAPRLMVWGSFQRHFEGEEKEETGIIEQRFIETEHADGLVKTGWESMRYVWRTIWRGTVRSRRHHQPGA